MPAPDRAASSPNPMPLWRLLGLAADAVQAVRAGRSLTDVLAGVPPALRPGVQSLSFHALRWLGGATEARALLAPKLPPPAVDALLVTALALLWPAPAGAAPPYPDHTLVDQAVAAARRRAPASANFVNAVLRRFVREREATVDRARRTPLGAWNHPPWWVARLAADWPDDWQRVLADANHRPPMTLRVNARAARGADYLKRLAEQGRMARLVDALPGAGAASQALVLAEPCPVGALPGFDDGAVSVQDAAAQRAAPLLLGLVPAAEAVSAAQRDTEPETAGGRVGDGDGCGSGSGSRSGGRAAGDDGRLAVPVAPIQAPPAARSTPPADTPRPGPPLPPLRAGARVLDACAAPGGKTAHLLELATLDLLALDVDPVRLQRVGDGLRRLRLMPSARGAADADIDADGSRVELRVGDARQPDGWWDGRPFDAILLDAPCTASGIVSRHPDVRWLRRAADVDALVATQAAMLDALWPLLAPGGRLLYATCSVFKAEGVHQIDAFLQRLPAGAARLHPHSPGHLLPSRDNPGQGEPGRGEAPRDGFFYALIDKKA